MDEIKKLSELNEEQVNQAIAVLVDGFFNVFQAFQKTKKSCISCSNIHSNMKWHNRSYRAVIFAGFPAVCLLFLFILNSFQATVLFVAFPLYHFFADNSSHF